MALTEEQRKRMEENRKRALEIKRKKQLEREQKGKILVEGNNPSVFEAGGFVGGSSETVESQSKKRRLNDALPDDNAEGKGGNVKEITGRKSEPNNGDYNQTTEDSKHDNDDESSIEEFEQNASPYVSQTEAQRTYCLPQGTLAVCSYIEKDNPHKRGWNKMKLYNRSEVRRRARKRCGGKEGLIQEREKRKKKRFEKDVEDMKDVFR